MKKLIFFTIFLFGALIYFCACSKNKGPDPSVYYRGPDYGGDDTSLYKLPNDLVYCIYPRNKKGKWVLRNTENKDTDTFQLLYVSEIPSRSRLQSFISDYYSTKYGRIYTELDRYDTIKNIIGFSMTDYNSSHFFTFISDFDKNLLDKNRIQGGDSLIMRENYQLDNGKIYKNVLCAYFHHKLSAIYFAKDIGIIRTESRLYNETFELETYLEK